MSAPCCCDDHFGHSLTVSVMGHSKMAKESVCFDFLDRRAVQSLLRSRDLLNGAAFYRYRKAQISMLKLNISGLERWFSS